MFDQITDGRTDLVFDYVDAGHAATSADQGGMSPIRWWAYYGDVSAVKFLLANGESLQSLGENHELNGAAFHGHSRLCRFLIGQGADVNKPLADMRRAYFYSRTTTALVAAAIVYLAGQPVEGREAVSSYTDFEAFRSVVGPESTIGFTEVPLGTTVGDEYAPFGLRFTDGNDETEFNPQSYLTDNVGLAGGPEGRSTFITLQFANPVRSLGVDFPGALRIELFSGTTSLGASENFGSTGADFFGGVVSDTPFDRVVLSDWFAGDVYIDNLHVAPVPEPTTWALLAFGAVLACLWRRGVNRDPSITRTKRCAGSHF